MNMPIAVGMMLVSALFNSMGALLLKMSSASFGMNIKRLMTNKYLIFGLISYLFSTAVALPAYRFAEISLLYPLISTTYIWTCLFSLKYLKESMNLWKWTGVFLILVGVSFIGIGSM